MFCICVIAVELMQCGKRPLTNGEWKLFAGSEKTIDLNTNRNLPSTTQTKQIKGLYFIIGILFKVT
jgi:hypothetical protein